MRRTRYFTLGLLILTTCVMVGQSHVPPPGQVMMQLNICGAGQWVTTIKDNTCELHSGSTENPSQLVVVSAKDYADWLGHKWQIGVFPDLHFHEYGDNLLRQLAPRIEKNLHSDLSTESCFPMLPEHGSQSPIPGCSDSRVAVSPLHSATRCPPNSNVFQMLRLAVANHLEVPTLRVQPESDFWKDLGADDLDGMELIMVAEEYFDIEIEDDKAKTIRTVRDMAQIVQAKICP